MNERVIKEVAITLRRLAKDVKDTAIGSSRVAMYSDIAFELEAQATRLETAVKP